MNTPGILYKGLILATVLILSTFFVNAQQLLDDFNRTSSATVGGTTLGAPAWSEVETGSTTTTGCNINSNYLRLSSSSSAGREYVFRNCSPDYNTVLSSNTVQLIWQFKMRQTATATSPPNDLSGFSSGYGMAVILGATTSNFLTANGYAITLGTPGTSTDPLRLVRFTGGLSSDANLTDILTTLYMTPNRRDFDDEYIAVKVIYTPSTNFWQVYVDEDNNEFNDVSYANANLYGTGTDAVYTGSNLGFVGALYNHSTSTSLFGSLDEIYIPITPGPPVTYYSKSTGDLNFTTTWGINLDGSGTNPPNFTTSNQTFNIRNNFSPTISANWTVSGLLAKVILGDTISNIEFTVPANFAFTGPIDISSYSKLNLGNVTVPTIGAIAIPSIVEYSSTLTQTISANVYWDLICSSTGGRTWPSGTVGILDTFVVGLNAFNSSSGTVDFMGTQTQYIPPIRYPNMTNSGGGDRIFAPSGIIVISGTFTPSIGIYTVTGSTINFASSSATSIPVLSVNGGPNYNNLIKSGSGDLEIQGVMLIGGDLTITSGKFLQNTGNTIYTLAIDGDLIISGGDYYFSTGTGANVLTLKGNLTQTSGRTRVSGTVLGRITFAGSSLQVISASDSTRFESCIFTVSNGAYVRLAQNLTLQRSASIPLSLKGTMNVNSGGTLDCSTFRISSGIGASGNVVINLNSGATLVTSNPNGVYGTGGSISSINTVTTFNSLANYKFNSGSPQFPGLSNTTMNNLTIDNTANVTLTVNILANGVITFINGKFNTTSSFKITSGLFGTVTGAGAGKSAAGRPHLENQGSGLRCQAHRSSAGQRWQETPFLRRRRHGAPAHPRKNAAPAGLRQPALRAGCRQPGGPARAAAHICRVWPARRAHARAPGAGQKRRRGEALHLRRHPRQPRPGPAARSRRSGVQHR